jgi:hypothetical protein
VSLGAAENGAVEHLLVRHPEAEYSLAVGTRDCGIGRKPSSVPFSRHSCTASCALACSAARNRIKAKPQALRSWRKVTSFPIPLRIGLQAPTRAYPLFLALS